MVGNFVTSRAGRDKGDIYIILKEDKKYIYVVDGKNRLVEKPKKKNRKHIQWIVKTQDMVIKNKIQQGDIPKNEEIRKAIQNYGN